MTRLRDLKIAVLAGGTSSEREVSLRSGAAVHQALVGKGFDAVLLDVDGRAAAQARAAGADLAFIALHGVFGEDGGVQSALEEAGIPYTGSGPEACRRAMDKEASRKVLNQSGFAEPRWRVIRGGTAPPGAPSDLEYPFFVKPCRGGSSIGVSQVKSEAEWPAAWAAARAEDDKVIVESKVTGREMAVGILGDHALPVIEICPARDFYDYTAKYSDSGTRYVFPDDLTPAVLKRIQENALRAHRALGCGGFSRVDLILTAAADYVLEVNAIPGLTAASLLPKQALKEGIQFADLCVMMIRESIKTRGQFYE